MDNVQLFEIIATFQITVPFHCLHGTLTFLSLSFSLSPSFMDSAFWRKRVHSGGFVQSAGLVNPPWDPLLCHTNREAYVELRISAGCQPAQTTDTFAPSQSVTQCLYYEWPVIFALEIKMKYWFEPYQADDWGQMSEKEWGRLLTSARWLVTSDFH